MIVSGFIRERFDVDFIDFRGKMEDMGGKREERGSGEIRKNYWEENENLGICYWKILVVSL